MSILSLIFSCITENTFTKYKKQSSCFQCKMAGWWFVQSHLFSLHTFRTPPKTDEEEKNTELKETDNYVHLVGLKCVRSVNLEDTVGEINKIREYLLWDQKRRCLTLVGILGDVWNLPESQLYQHLPGHPLCRHSSHWWLYNEVSNVQKHHDNEWHAVWLIPSYSVSEEDLWGRGVEVEEG